MKRILVFVAALCMSASLAAAQRLPQTAVPQNYKLTFAPDFEREKFTGDETIAINLLKPTPEIVLNAVDIDFQTVSITSNGETQTAKVSLDKDKQMATLSVPKPLSEGGATIQIHYSGILNNELRGFYLGKDEKGRKYAVTQFEATDARRAFPSFDEPAFKATFDITVIADKKHAVISNGKVIADKPGPGEGKHTVTLSTSPRMSSYLVAVAVGEFEYIQGEADGIPIRVWATPGKKEMDRFALNSAEYILKYYNRYFGIKYPFEKLDLIGLPDFAAGAMENTACITFREVILQIDDEQGSVGLHKEVAGVLAHEMAHQWFGDLVTMKWWDDIWLNEGFATWMESKPVAEWKPEWNVELDDVAGTNTSLRVDSLLNTRPIHQAAETPAQISELFDGIAYGKTAAVLRMLEAYLGPETFRAGVNEYLKQHAYGNATAEDFWSALARVSQRPVDKIMPTFVNQPGAPFLAVKSECDAKKKKSTVALAQQRYVYDREQFAADKSNELWQIPVCLKRGPTKEGEKPTTSCDLLTEKQAQLPFTGCAPWVFSNAGANGFYRSGYEADDINAIASVIETDLTPAERIILIGDTWAAVRVGRQSVGNYLALGEGFRPERSRPVLSEYLEQMDFLADYLTTDADREAFRSWVRQMLAPAAKDLGWQSKPGESDENRSLRGQIMYTLGAVGHDPEALKQAQQLASQALEKPGSVDSTLVGTALAIAAMQGDAALYNRMLDRMKNAATPEEYYLYLHALPQFDDAALADRTLKFVLTDEVRVQDKLRVISEVMQNHTTSETAWNFVRAHWSEVEKNAGPFTGAAVVRSTSVFCDAAKREEVKSFFTEHKPEQAERTMQQSIERIGACIDLKAQQTPQLAAWLSQHAASPSPK